MPPSSDVSANSFIYTCVSPKQTVSQHYDEMSGPIFCRSFVQDSSLIIDNLIRAAVVLFTMLTIRSAVADPQVNIFIYYCCFQRQA